MKNIKELEQYDAKLVERFIRYAKFETRSDSKSGLVPSTACQIEFQKMLAAEMKEIGFSDVYLDEGRGVLTASVPSTLSVDIPAIAFIAHVDTADFNAENVNPKIHDNYDGLDIVLNKGRDIVLSSTEFPSLKNYIGQTLITTSGDTLLGADDKAGVAEIMTACEYILNNKDIEHGDIKIVFGTDEEIGEGAERIDVKKLNAKFAFTMDGGPVGELEYESFNACEAKIFIKGKNIHPGSAKDTMINALKIANEIQNAMPEFDVPETTCNREGFIHLVRMEGVVDSAYLEYIIRDHDKNMFEAKKAYISRVVKYLNDKYENRISLELKDEYYNMGEIIKNDMTPVELANKAMENLGIEVITKPIRGGTDGSRLSFMGLPTPNIFAGGENFHGRYEFIAVESMIKAKNVIIEIVKLSKSYLDK